jgi:hypothetical protein
MLYPIEIKVNLDGGVDDALAALGQPEPTAARLIWFAEDRDGLADGTLRLQSGGVILRVRSGGPADDSTAKLRPCSPSQLRNDWANPFDRNRLEYTIEGDWSGPHRVRAASARSSFAQGSLVQERGGGARLSRDALTAKQLRFLQECAGIPVDVGRLVALGPIESQKWTDLPLADMEVNAERWRAAGLDFLELSIRVQPKHGDKRADLETRAEKRQAELTASVEGMGLQIAVNNDNKTHRVLTALAAAVVH